MKKLLLATSILAASAGFASAEVAVSGSARMGLIYDGNLATDQTRLTSRVRVVFTMSGETDGGLAFGASVRNDQSGQGNTSNGDSTVFVSGAFGKLTFGDVDTAANALVGNVSGVGLTGLNDWNELGYEGQTKTAALYEYTTGSLTLALSVGQTTGPDEAAIAAKYVMGDYSFAIGYESSSLDDRLSAGATATFGAITGKLVVTDEDSDPDLGVALSVDYTSGPLVVTAYASQNNSIGADAYGLGASYDLGGGAKVVGGIADANIADTVADFGLSFSF
jgi:outer membrane protein OmpU